MARPRLTVVLSQARSKNPAKRGLEENICAALLLEPGVDVSVVPHLYDLTEEHTGMLFLRSVAGDLVVLSWLYPRAAQWVLDRFGVKGHSGSTLLKPDNDQEHDDEDDDSAEEDSAAEASRVIGAVDVPDRRIYCLDLRDCSSADAYIEEIRRIAAEARVETVSIGGLVQSSPAPLQLTIEPTAPAETDTGNGGAVRPLEFLEQPPERRWYPVIDFSRCTNCLECIDFCLFGVYGVDGAERILVDQPDNCRKGCPACSRVCPENAIVFPEHKTPAIAGAPGEGPGALKIDLSKLFGAPDAVDLAAQERDIELIKAGRGAVGLSVGIPKRRAHEPAQPKDELDELIDALEASDV